jgi:hypothetical protein
MEALRGREAGDDEEFVLYESDSDKEPVSDGDISYEPVNFQLLSLGSNSKKVKNNLLFGLLTAEGYNLEGFGLAFFGLSNNSVLGLETAGVYTIVDKDMYGIQTAGLLNIVGKDMYGIQATGLFNIAGWDMYGIQGSWLFNITERNSGGIQAASLFNITGRAMLGIQAAGVFNIADGGDWNIGNTVTIGPFKFADSQGGPLVIRAQAAGLFNIIGDNFVGLQAAGVFNIARNNFYGIQAALVNVSGDSEPHHGFSVQVGLVNVSANERDIPIGLVNIVKNGILNPAIYYDTYNMFNFSFKSGSRYFYSLFSVASSQISLGDVSFGKSDAGDLLITRAGIGFEFPLGQFFLDADVAWGNILDLSESQDIADRHTSAVQTRLTLGHKFFKHFSVFAGVSYDYFYREHELSPMPAYAWDDVLPGAWSNEQHIHKLGFFAGIQF